MKTRVQRYLDALEFLDSRQPIQAEELLYELERLADHNKQVHALSFLLGVRFAEHVQGFGRLMYEVEE